MQRCVFFLAYVSPYLIILLTDLDPIIRKPALMVTAAKDAALPPSLTKNMHKYIPDLTQHNVEDAAHWVLWEKPEECNKHLLNWLNKVSPAKL